MATQHASLSAERWSGFNLDQQILMIGNEMNRARGLLAHRDWARVRSCYERVLQLVDLTVGVQSRRHLRRELLRWRDLIAQLYLSAEPGREEHDASFKCLLRFTPAASKQIAPLLGGPPTDPSA